MMAQAQMVTLTKLTDEERAELLKFVTSLLKKDVLSTGEYKETVELRASRADATVWARMTPHVLSQMQTALKTLHSACTTLDHVKKWLFYGKESAGTALNLPHYAEKPVGYNGNWDYLHAVLGLMSELPELVDGADGTLPELDNASEEFGDIMWYVMLAHIALGLDMGAVLAANNRKLDVRYKGAFTAQAANNRDLKSEAAALMGSSSGIVESLEEIDGLIEESQQEPPAEQARLSISVTAVDEASEPPVTHVTPARDEWENPVASAGADKPKVAGNKVTWKEGKGKGK